MNNYLDHIFYICSACLSLCIHLFWRTVKWSFFFYHILIIQKKESKNELLFSRSLQPLFNLFISEECLINHYIHSSTQLIMPLTAGFFLYFLLTLILLNWSPLEKTAVFFCLKVYLFHACLFLIHHRIQLDWWNQRLVAYLTWHKILIDYEETSF